MAVDGITIAICTRNRYKDLLNCTKSIGNQKLQVPIELLIVDDGQLSSSELGKIHSVLKGSGSVMLRYFKKSEPGLYLSRIEAVKKGTYDTLLFVDDDIELEDGYLSELIQTFIDTGAVGVGGVDTLSKPNRFWWNLFSLLTGYRSLSSGKLSLSGYAGSIDSWIKKTVQFESEFLPGCNMAFQKHVLEGLEVIPWLQDYSLGEDVYISTRAAKFGKLIINPRLRVKHHVSPVSRDKDERTAYTEIVNHYYLFRVREREKYTFIFLLWTYFGLYTKAVVFRRGDKRMGYARAMKFVLRDVLFAH